MPHAWFVLQTLLNRQQFDERFRTRNLLRKEWKHQRRH